MSPFVKRQYTLNTLYSKNDKKSTTMEQKTSFLKNMYTKMFFVLQSKKKQFDKKQSQMLSRVCGLFNK